MKANFNEYLVVWRERIEQVLEKYLAKENLSQNELYQAIHYSVFSGGKRLRPILVYASGETFNANLDDLDAPACAIELIHTFSLIHDDLPAMDNDDYRRGKPSCHKKFGEAMALLAGDALICLAVEILPTISMIKELMRATGAQGMVAGQALDITLVGADNIVQLENLYMLKTAALFKASIKLGALTSNNCNNYDMTILDKFADIMGLAFQIKDDIDDAAKNEMENKVTYTSLVGLQKSQTKVKELHEQAMLVLDELSHDTFLLKSLVNLILHL